MQFFRICFLIIAFISLRAASLSAHPLDGLTAKEYQEIQSILHSSKVADEHTLFPLIDLKEPSKKSVLAWRKAKPKNRKALDRRATVVMTGTEGFYESIVNITKKKVESKELIKGSGQPMILFEEFIGAITGATSHPDMQKGLEKRGLKSDDIFCLPLTAGNFFTEAFEKSRLMKVPCYVSPTGSNFYAKPIEGLFATYDIGKKHVVEIIDTGVITIPKDQWGYTEQEVAKRVPLRPITNPAVVTQKGEPNFTVEKGALEWDMWRLNLRTEKRAGLVVSNVDVNDQGTWRSIIYQTHLSEVFVPYMDPTEGWYWRTYMDSGEYGFGLFMTPLEAGIDCPVYATFLPALIADDKGNPLEIPNAICVFERNIGDPAWRHYEVFAQEPNKFVPAEGRPETELVIRTASEVGNYDYLIDYRLKQDGQLYIKIGATGLDAVKGVASQSTHSKSYKEDTRYGTLIAPNLVAANHDHYFNFRIDFDIDQPVNHAATMDIVPATPEAGVPRRSMWSVKHTMLKSELDARYKTSTAKPRYLHISNNQREGYLGHNPGYMLHHGSVAYGPFDFEKDPPMKRNAYIKYAVWNTLYDPQQRYAGGKYAVQSDGSDTLDRWVQADRSLMHSDIVTWFTAGFHHIPRMEDWPVMSTEWKTVHIMPHNFFAHNPALTIRNLPKNAE